MVDQKHDQDYDIAFYYPPDDYPFNQSQDYGPADYTTYDYHGYAPPRPCDCQTSRYQPGYRVFNYTKDDDDDTPYYVSEDDHPDYGSHD